MDYSEYNSTVSLVSQRVIWDVLHYNVLHNKNYFFDMHIVFDKKNCFGKFPLK